MERVASKDPYLTFLSKLKVLIKQVYQRQVTELCKLCASCLLMARKRTCALSAPRNKQKCEVLIEMLGEMKADCLCPLNRNV